MQGARNVDVLVLDTAQFVKKARIEHLANRFVTCAEVVAEVKDVQSRLYLDQLLQSQRLTITQPTHSSTNSIIAFSKLTGDFPSLSLTDIKVLALVHTLEQQMNGGIYLRPTPTTASTNTQKMMEIAREKKEKSEMKRKESLLAKSVKSGNVNGDEATERQMESVSELVKKLRSVTITPPHSEDEMCPPRMLWSLSILETIHEEPHSPLTMTSSVAPLVPSVSIDTLVESIETTNEVERVEDDSDGEWITPANLTKHINKQNCEPSKKKYQARVWDVGCVTTDFAMQNVMLQMNMRLLSIDGMAIDKIKTFVLRCHACYTVTRDMERKFCDKCGNAALMRTSMGVAKDGTVIYYLKKNMTYNLRGTKYAMPKTKGGKKTIDLIYREDQKEFLVGMKRKGVKKGGSILDPDLVVEGRRGAVLGPVIGYGRVNPNEKNKH